MIPIQLSKADLTAKLKENIPLTVQTLSLGWNACLTRKPVVIQLLEVFPTLPDLQRLTITWQTQRTAEDMVSFIILFMLTVLFIEISGPACARLKSCCRTAQAEESQA